MGVPGNPRLFLAMLGVLFSLHLPAGPQISTLHADQYRTKTSGVHKAKAKKETVADLEKRLQDLESAPYAKALVLRNMANAYATDNDYDKAVESLEQVLETKALSRYAEQDVLIQLAQLYMATGQYDRVIEALEKAGEEGAFVEAETYITLGMAYVELGQQEKAIKPLRAGIERAEGINEEWYRLLLFAHYRLGQFHGCVEVLEKMIQLFPERKEYWIQLSSMYTKLDDSEKALAVMDLAYMEALLDESKDQVLLAQMLIAGGAPFKAGVLLTEGLESGIIADSAKNLELLAVAWVQAKEAMLAIPVLQEAFLLSDKDTLLLWLCQLYMETESWHEAIDTIDQALGKARREQERFERLRKKRALPEGAERPLVLRSIGKLYLMLGIACLQLSEMEMARQAFGEAAPFGGVSQQANEWLAYMDSGTAGPMGAKGLVTDPGITEEQRARIAKLRRHFRRRATGRKEFLAAGRAGTGVLEGRGAAIEYTPIGAIANASRTGDLPAFEGASELTCPEGFEKGDVLPDPYTDEEVLFRIDHSNVEQHKSRLTPGQVARLRMARNYYMNIYPTHRNYEFHEKFLEATKRNATTVRLNNTIELVGHQGGLPFPFPKNGIEAMYNARKSGTMFDLTHTTYLRAIAPSGKIKLSRVKEQWLVFDNSKRLLGDKLPNPDDVAGKLSFEFISPSADTGLKLLLNVFLEDGRSMDNWIYIPLLRRVKRIQNLFDDSTSVTNSATGDELFGYTGSFHDWNWKLAGRREIYVPANNYNLWAMDASDKEECPPMSMNPERVRYELRRVWVVEGTPRGAHRHPYSRRVRYYDEDTWFWVTYDNYDNDGRIFRLGELYISYDYCHQFAYHNGTMMIDVQTGHYDVYGGRLRKDSKMPIVNTGLLQPEAFTLGHFRRTGR